MHVSRCRIVVESLSNHCRCLPNFLQDVPKLYDSHASVTEVRLFLVGNQTALSLSRLPRDQQAADEGEALRYARVTVGQSRPWRRAVESGNSALALHALRGLLGNKAGVLQVLFPRGDMTEKDYDRLNERVLAGRWEWRLEPEGGFDTRLDSPGDWVETAQTGMGFEVCG